MFSVFAKLIVIRINTIIISVVEVVVVIVVYPCLWLLITKRILKLDK